MRTFIAFPCFRPTHEQWLALEQFIGEYRARVTGEASFCVINDGSPDFLAPPPALLEKLRLEHLPSNQGKGAALRKAVEIMPDGFDVFGFMDFDLPYSLEDLVGVCAAVGTGADACIGVRTEPEPAGSSDRLSRQISHRLFRLFVRSVVVGSISDTQCGVKAFRADAVKWIAGKSRLNGFLFDMEWLYIALHHSLCVRQWPVAVEESHRSGRLSSYRLQKLAMELLSLITNILKRSYNEPRLTALAKSQRDILVARFTRP